MNFLKSKKLYPILAAAAFIAVVILLLVVPDRFKEPDDWAYRYAVENMSHGRLTVDDTLHKQQVTEAAQQGGQLGQYVQIRDHTWAFEKSPGYVYFLIPFFLAGVPQLANMVLATGLALATYLLLKRLKDEQTACLGVFFVLFTPIGLAMMQREYMDSFSSAAFLGIGGALYIYYCLSANMSNQKYASITLFSAGFLLAAGVASRYTDATVAGVFAAHFIITRVLKIRQGKWSRVWREGLPLAVGAAIPIALLLWYQYAVFGSLFTYGYEYTKGDVTFAYQYLGDPRFWQIISTNIRHLSWPLVIGFPLLLLSIPAGIIGSWQKITNGVGRLRKYHRNDWWPELTPGIWMLMLGWVIAVFGLYVMYQWTANQGTGRPFITVTRFYLPALFPLAMFAALLLRKIPGKLAVFSIAVAVISGGLLFAQSSTTPLAGGPPRPHSQNQPPGQLSPAELAKLIDGTRAEVKATPTTQITLQPRLDVLTRWVGELNRQGYPVGQVIPPQEINHIQNLISQGNIVQACISVDTDYAKLEQLVSKP